VARSNANGLVVLLFRKTLAQAMTVNYLEDMSHQHLESRGHIFTNRANIAYLPTRLRSSRNNDRGTTNKDMNYVDVDQMLLLTRTVSMTLCIRIPLINSTTSCWSRCIGSCGSVSVFVREVLPSLTDTKTMGSHKQVAS
jgi:hypothetical protein